MVKASTRDFSKTQKALLVGEIDRYSLERSEQAYTKKGAITMNRASRKHAELPNFRGRNFFRESSEVLYQCEIFPPGS
jgi:hypothetical protein